MNQEVKAKMKKVGKTLFLLCVNVILLYCIFRFNKTKALEDGIWLLFYAILSINK